MATLMTTPKLRRTTLGPPQLRRVEAQALRFQLLDRKSLRLRPWFLGRKVVTTVALEALAREAVAMLPVARISQYTMKVATVICRLFPRVLIGHVANLKTTTIFAQTISPDMDQVGAGLRTTEIVLPRHLMSQCLVAPLVVVTTNEIHVAGDWLC